MLGSAVFLVRVAVLSLLLGVNISGR